RRAADDDGRDGIKLEPEAEIGRGYRIEAGGEQRGGDAHHDAIERIGPEAHPVDPYSGVQGNPGIGTDRADIPAVPGVVEYE
ncbi:MAG: hypothetical protein UY31_C0027G0009, partial [Candidatus Wolfebacteria bacterium GW2011_GWE1_48_7]